jgi:glycosyltransferase involved in cell wall biosynthesis
MPETDGNYARMRQVLRFLMDSGDFNVIFYSYSETREPRWTAKDEAKFRAMFPRVVLVHDKTSRRIQIVERIKSNFTALVPALTARIVRIGVPGLTPKWAQLRAEHPDGLYLLNYALSAVQLNGIDLSKSCIESHDLCFRAHADVRGRPIWNWEVLRYLRRELSILDAAAIVLAIAYTEKTILDAFLRKPRICYLPPHYRPQREVEQVQEAEQVQSEMTAREKTDLLFLGSDNFKNIRGINEFLKDYRRWKIRPDLAIAGKVSTHAEVNPARDRTIKVLGYVADLPSLYESVRATICPIEGTGVNIKLLEALSYGKPTFASQEAIAALPPGSEDCVFPLTETSVRELIDNPAKLRLASVAALKYVDSPYVRGLWSDFRQALLDA